VALLISYDIYEVNFRGVCVCFFLLLLSDGFWQINLDQVFKFVDLSFICKSSFSVFYM